MLEITDLPQCSLNICCSAKYHTDNYLMQRLSLFFYRLKIIQIILKYETSASII